MSSAGFFNKHFKNVTQKPVTDEQSELKLNQMNNNVVLAVAPVNITFAHTVININPKSDPRSPKESPRSSISQEEQKRTTSDKYVAYKPGYVCCWPFNLCCWKKPTHKKEATRLESELVVNDSPRMTQ